MRALRTFIRIMPLMLTMNNAFVITSCNGNGDRGGNRCNITIDESMESNKNLEILINMVCNEDPLIRSNAAERLGDYRKKHELIVPVLISLLNDPDWRTRSAAARSLGFFKSKALGAASKLILLLRDENPSVREMSASTIGSIGARTATISSALIKLLDDEDPDVRNSAVYALGEVSFSNEESVERISELLKVEIDPNVKESCAISLGRIGSGNESAIKSLSEILNEERNRDADASLQVISSISLWLIDHGNELAKRKFKSFMKIKHGFYRRSAMEVFLDFRSIVKTEDIKDLLEGESEFLIEFMEYLVESGPDASSLLKAVMEISENDSEAAAKAARELPQKEHICK